MQKQVSFPRGPGLETMKGWEWRLGWVTLKELFMEQRSSVSYSSGCGMQNEPHTETADAGDVSCPAVSTGQHLQLLLDYLSKTSSGLGSH